MVFNSLVVVVTWRRNGARIQTWLVFMLDCANWDVYWSCYHRVFCLMKLLLGQFLIW